MASIKVIGQVDALASVPQEQGFWSKHSSASGFRSKAVLDTPSTVSSFPAELLRDQQAKSLADITKNDSSTVVSSSPLWFDRVSVRGFALSVDAVQRDGLSVNDQGKIALENKAAVELSKGLSALRYGVTSPGGVVNYVVKRPTEEPMSRVALSANSFGAKGIHGDFGGRFGDEDQFGVRVNIAKDDIANHTKQTGERTFFSTFLDWRVTDNFLVELDFEHHDHQTNSVRTLNLGSFADIATAKEIFPKLDAKSPVVESWTIEPNRQTYLATHFHYKINDAWRSSLSLHESKLWRHQNSTSVGSASLQPNGDYDVYLYYAPDQERNNRGLLLLVEGDFSTGLLDHELAFGYNSIRRDMTWPDSYSGQIGTNNLFSPVSITNPRQSSGPSYLGNRTEQTSLFVADTISFSDWLQVFGGLRQTEIIRYAGSPDGLTKNYDKSAITPTLGVVYKPQPNLSLYTSYATGIELGGTAPNSAINRGEVMNPLESHQIEVGAKYELTPETLLTLAVFQIDKGLEYVNAANYFVQDGRQVHKGLELNFSGRATDNLRMIAGFAYLDARVEKTANTALIGKRPRGIPEWQTNLYADYDLSSVMPGLSINSGLYYSGEKAIDNLNTWMADSYIRMDAGIRYQQRLSDKRFATYRFNVENLTDKRYLANTSGGSLDFGAPRMAKASVEIDF